MESGVLFGTKVLAYGFLAGGAGCGLWVESSLVVYIKRVA